MQRASLLRLLLTRSSSSSTGWGASSSGSSGSSSSSTISCAAAAATSPAAARLFSSVTTSTSYLKALHEAASSSRSTAAAAAARAVSGAAASTSSGSTSSTSSSVIVRAFASSQCRRPIVRLEALRDAPGATAQLRRVGRGNGSGRGSYSGRGVKGQKARKGNGKPGILFDGGTKGLKKLPKVGATPSNPVTYARVNVGDVADYARAGHLDAGSVITMHELRAAGVAPKRVLWGVKLLGRGAERVDRPLHLQVSAVSAPARTAVEAAGGSVTTVYYNRLGLRALLKPEAFEKAGRRLPSPPRAWPPRDNGKFDAIGALPPAPAPRAAALVGGGGGASAVTPPGAAA